MTEINRENLSAAIEEAVAEKGSDFVYPDEWRQLTAVCQYVLPDGSPACLFGNALMRLGVSAELLRTYNKNNIIDVLYILKVEDAALHSAASKAQSEQDFGSTWGYAADRFHQVLAGEKD